MADKEINDLADGGAAQSGDLVHVVRSGNSRKVALEAQLPATRASSSGPASLQFHEDTDSGINKVTLQAPSALAGDVTLTLPSKAGTVALESDTDRRNQLLIAAGVAKALAGYQRLLDGFADGYKASDGIAAGSSSNYTVDTTAGCVKPTIGSPTLIADGTGTAIGGEGTATNPGNCFDNNDTTYASGADNAACYVGKNWGGTSHVIGRFIVKSPTGRSFTGGATDTINWELAGSNDGSSWTAIDSGSVSDVVSTQVTIDRTVANPTTGYSYHRVRLSRGTIAGWRVAEMDLYEAGTPASMTVVTTLQTADGARTKGRVLLEIDDVTGGSTINTDLTAEFSCNNQANYTAGTLTLVGAGQGGRKVYETEEMTCTSGTVLSARLKTANAKDIRVYKAAWKGAAA